MENFNLKTYLILIFGLFCLAPAMASASTYQDVQNYLNENPAPSGCVNWVEEVTTEAGKGYRVWQRCNSSSVLAQIEDTATVLFFTRIATVTLELTACDGGATSTSTVAVGQTFYAIGGILRYSTYCNGDRTSSQIPGEYSFFAGPPPCTYYSVAGADCHSLDTLLTDFPIVDQCLNKLTNTPESCAQNCKDPVNRASQTIIEICGDGIDNNCDGQVDEGCPSSGLSGDSDINQCMGSAANLNSGNLYHSQTLLQIQNPRLPIDFTVSYNSNDANITPLGKGWTHNYNLSITENPDTSLSLKKPDGDVTYFYLSNGTYYSSAQSGDHSTIIKNADGTYTQTLKDKTTYSFNSSASGGGRLFQIKDRNNNTTTLTYAGSDLAGITDSTGRLINITSGNGKILSITDPANRAYTFTYSGDSLIAITDPANNTWQYTYDANSRMLTKTDPNGNITTYAYDANGKLLSSQDPETKTKAISYNPTTHTSIVTEKDGGIWTYKYDNTLNIPLEVTDPQGNITKYTYDYNKNLLSKTEPDGSATKYTYDAQGNILTQTDALNQTTTYTYNADNQITSITDPKGQSFSFAYDASGNLTQTIDPTGATTSYQYDTKGNLSQLTNANNQITKLTYDQYNNLISITDPVGQSFSFAYDNIGNMTSQTDAASATTLFEYNTLNQLIKITDPNGNITQYTYDKNGNKISATDANGSATSLTYSAKNQLTSVKDPLNNITQYTYSTGCPTCAGVDKLTSITDAKNQTTAYQYDNLSRLIKETDPLGNVITYTYNSKGNLTSRTDANNNTITYTYDSLNRLTKKTYPDSTTETWTYDANNNMLTAGNQYIAYTFTYDANNRITGVTDSNAKTITYQYDSIGNKTRMTAPDAKMTTYTYDANNRLTQILADAGQSFSFAYDNLNRRTRLTYPNGITANYTYDALSRLTNLLHKTSSNSTIDSFTYTYDNIGNKLTAIDTAGSHQYQYDPIYRLTGANHPTTSDEAYAYDPVGNRLTDALARTYTYNNGNELLTQNGTSFTYDANGNITTKTDSTGITLYQYDYENRLIQVNTQPVTGNPQLVTYKYDPFGRRIEKKTTTGNKSKTTKYLYDREDILYEYDSSNNITTKYIHGPGIDEPLAMIKSGNLYYYHADGLGSITSITSSRARISQQYKYDSFGNITYTKDTRFVQPFTYTGREYDSETGMYYFRNRYDDPKIGRFISKDPIGFNGEDVNLFSYVGNNPVNYIDPDGLEFFLFGRVPTVFRPRYIPEEAQRLPKATKPSSLKPEPPPYIPPEKIIQPRPEPLLARILRLLHGVEDYIDKIPTSPPLYDPLTPVNDPYAGKACPLIIIPYFRRRNKKAKELENKIESGIKGIDTFRELGKIYLDEGEHQKLLTLYKRALELPIDDYEKATVYYETGVAHYELGEKEEAILDLEKALNLSKDCEDSIDAPEAKGLIYYYLFLLYPSVEKSNEMRSNAIEHFEKLLVKYPSFERIVSIYLMLERLYSASGNHDKALEFVLKALELARNDSEKVESLNSIANIFRFKGDYLKAEDYYQQAINLVANDKSPLSGIYCGMGFLRKETGRKDEAIAYFEKALQYRAFDPSVKHDQDYVVAIECHTGKIYYEKKDYKKAVKHFKNAINIINESHKDFCNIQLWLGHCYYAIQDYKNAEGYYKRILSSKLTTEDEIIQAQLYLANISSQLREYENAVKKYEKLFELSPEHKEDPVILYSLGIAYDQLGNKLKAIAYLEKIVTDNLTTPLREDILYRLACLYLEQERYKEFNEYSKMLVHEFPGGVLTQKIIEYRRKYEFPKEGDNVHL